MRYSKKSLDLYEALILFGCSFSEEELSLMLKEHPMDFHEEYFKVAEERKVENYYTHCSSSTIFNKNFTKEA